MKSLSLTLGSVLLSKVQYYQSDYGPLKTKKHWNKAEEFILIRQLISFLSSTVCLIAYLKKGKKKQQLGKQTRNENS